MAVSLEKFKLYMRIDTDYEDVLLQTFLDTARHYLIGAISNFETNYASSLVFADKADLLQMIVAAEYYQNRDNTAHAVNYSYSGLLRQLQYWAEVESVDSSTTIVEQVTYTTTAILGGKPP